MKTLHDGTKVSNETPVKIIGKKLYLTTAEELAEKQTRLEAALIEQEKRRIKDELKELDKDVPRGVEDLFKVLSTEQKNSANQYLKDKIQTKANLREKLK